MADMLGIFQVADALVLLGLVVCVLIFLAVDPFFQPILRRAPLVGLGFGLFSHAMWLLGVWIPGASGFPWPRFTIDVCMLAIGIARAVVVIRDHHAQLRMAAAADSRSGRQSIA
jgi:hypothetical protein